MCCLFFPPSMEDRADGLCGMHVEFALCNASAAPPPTPRPMLLPLNVMLVPPPPMLLPLNVVLLPPPLMILPLTSCYCPPPVMLLPLGTRTMS